MATMSASACPSDIPASAYSESGRILHLDIIDAALRNANIVMGFVGKSGVIVLANKSVVGGPSCEKVAEQRVYTVDYHIGLTVVGDLADGKKIAEAAREAVMLFREEYDRPIPVNLLADDLAAVYHGRTVSRSERPFGCATLLSGWDLILGPKLYKIEPSGECVGYYACARGQDETYAKYQFNNYNFPCLCTTDLVNVARKLFVDICETQRKGQETPFDMSLVAFETKGLHVINNADWMNPNTSAKSDATQVDLITSDTNLLKAITAQKSDSTDSDEASSEPSPPELDDDEFLIQILGVPDFVCGECASAESLTVQVDPVTTDSNLSEAIIAHKSDSSEPDATPTVPNAAELDDDELLLQILGVPEFVCSDCASSEESSAIEITSDDET